MRRLIIVLALLLSLQLTSAVPYYADVSIIVDEAGAVDVRGTTNYPGLVDGHSFTSKRGKVWLLNITTDEPLESYVYTVSLPKGASINYIKASGSMRIEDDEGLISIRGAGFSEDMNVVVQYTISEQGSLAIYYLVGGLLLAGMVIILTFLKKPGKKPDISHLPKRQQEIIRLVRKHGRITQAELEKRLDWPKSSLSRNVESLKRQGLIEKKASGMSNVLVLK